MGEGWISLDDLMGLDAPPANPARIAELARTLEEPTTPTGVVRQCLEELEGMFAADVIARAGNAPGPSIVASIYRIGRELDTWEGVKTGIVRALARADTYLCACRLVMHLMPHADLGEHSESVAGALTNATVAALLEHWKQGTAPGSFAGLLPWFRPVWWALAAMARHCVHCPADMMSSLADQVAALLVEHTAVAATLPSTTQECNITPEFMLAWLDPCGSWLAGLLRCGVSLSIDALPHLLRVSLLATILVQYPAVARIVQNGHDLHLPPLSLYHAILLLRDSQQIDPPVQQLLAQVQDHLFLCLCHIPEDLMVSGSSHLPVAAVNTSMQLDRTPTVSDWLPATPLDIIARALLTVSKANCLAALSPCNGCILVKTLALSVLWAPRHSGAGDALSAMYFETLAGCIVCLLSQVQANVTRSPHIIRVAKMALHVVSELAAIPAAADIMGRNQITSYVAYLLLESYCSPCPELCKLELGTCTLLSGILVAMDSVNMSLLVSLVLLNNGILQFAMLLHQLMMCQSLSKVFAQLLERILKNPTLWSLYSAEQSPGLQRILLGISSFALTFCLVCCPLGLVILL
eukprot:gene1248-2706_t